VVPSNDALHDVCHDQSRMARVVRVRCKGSTATYVAWRTTCVESRLWAQRRLVRKWQEE
jgi:hypothetical protein